MRSQRDKWGFVGFAALGLALGIPLPVQADVLPPGSVVHDQTIGQWSANWWQWALSFAPPDDPFTDTTGDDARLQQSGPVFFVAGTAPGGPPAAERTFKVPGNKFLLVPLLVAELSQLEIGFDKTAEDVRQAAKELADQIDSLQATIDGVPVLDLFSHRETSPDFHFHAVKNNVIGDPEGNSGIAVADGYWLMLTPLSPGTHDIRFGGGISAFSFSVDVLDHIKAPGNP